MTISRAEARELVRRASTDIIFPGILRPIAYLSYFFVWGGRKVIDLTRIIKELIFGAKHPELHGLGLVLSVSSLPETQRWIATTARIVCIVRPLIRLSNAGHEVKQSATGLACSIFGDTEVSRSYQKVRGTLSRFSKTKVGFLINNRLPMFARRLGQVLTNMAFVAMYSCDLFEALTARKEDLVVRSLAELKETLDQIGKEQLLHAIDFHAQWMNEILHKIHPRLDVSSVKNIINVSAELKSIGGQAVEGAIDIMVRGILNMGGE